MTNHNKFVLNNKINTIRSSFWFNVCTHRIRSYTVRLMPVTHQALVSELDMAEFYVHAIAHCILMKLSHIIKV